MHFVGLFASFSFLISTSWAVPFYTCDKQKTILRNSTYGRISNGPYNYVEDSYCIWLIIGETGQYIYVKFEYIDLHCSDRLVLYNGNSTEAPIIGSYSGSLQPRAVFASSGSMLIYLFSNVKEVSGGFSLVYSIALPFNCQSGDQTECGDCAASSMFCFGAQNLLSQNTAWQLLDFALPISNLLRLGHQVIYSKVDDKLYLFGGTDFNTIYGDLLVYNFDNGKWANFSLKFDIKDFKSTVFESLSIPGTTTDLPNVDVESQENGNTHFISDKISEPNFHNGSHLFVKRAVSDNVNMFENMHSPKARYFHKICEFRNGFLLFGGILDDGYVKDDLWFYNFETAQWKLIQSKWAPKLHKHTLTTINDTVYLIGGVNEYGLYSGKIYSIKIDKNLTVHKSWSEVRVKGARMPALAGHSSVYDHQSNLVVIYGGLISNTAKESKLSNKMFLLDLQEGFLSEINQKLSGLESHVPIGRVFHTAVIVGRYMVVMGGLTNIGASSVTCMDSKIYFYNMDCHVWVAHSVLDPVLSDFGNGPGPVYAQAAAVRNGSEVIVHGGYSGSPEGSLWSYRVPYELVGSEKDGYDFCYRYKAQVSCTGNPMCGWCPTDGSCTRRNNGANCSTNLQTTPCPGVCSSLSSCEACVRSKCVWCVQSAKCQKREDNNFCGTGFETPSGNHGFWGGEGVHISTPHHCRTLDFRPGVTFMVYEHPANFFQPDFVSILNATVAKIFYKSDGVLNPMEDGNITARMVGYIYPSACKSRGDMEKRIFLESFNGFSTLLVSKDDSVANLEPVGTTSDSDPSSKTEIIHPNQTSVFPETNRSQRYLMELVATIPIKQRDGSATMMLSFSKSGNPRPFSFECVEPYINGSCFYTNCLHCLTDAQCIWCESQQRCQRRESEACNSTSDHAILAPSQCQLCSDIIYCEECTQSTSCEWIPQQAVCTRRGRVPGAVISRDSCPIPCHQRNTCGLCLDGPGDCTWCDSSQECFSYSAFHNLYPFGTCSSWTSHEDLSLLTASPVRGDFSTSGKIVPKKEGRCKSCEQKDRCGPCLREPGCGWCFSVHNPLLGVCTSGDFFTPKSGNCSSVLQGLEVSTSTEMPRWDWAFSECPDIDECNLLLADCHAEALCVNIHLSYSCICKRGFTGDGKENCTRTCYEECVHGSCSGHPDYRCICDLGWTGPNCDIDCQCYGHATCSLGVGICDECQHQTSGLRCHFCRSGSYGDPKSQSGCQSCFCNGHGNVTAGVCDTGSGICFCMNNTEGPHCDKCKPGYYGDPRNGGICYRECFPRAVLTGVTHSHLGSPVFSSNKYDDCLWVLSVSNDMNVNENKDGSVIQLTIHGDSVLPCPYNYLYIFEGVPSFLMTERGYGQDARVIATLCDPDSSFPKTVEAHSGIMTIRYKKYSAAHGFNATFQLVKHLKDKSELMPRNISCSVDTGQGKFDEDYGRCICTNDFAGEDCSQHKLSSSVVFRDLFDPLKLSPKMSHWRYVLPRFGHSLVPDHKGNLWLFGGQSLTRGFLNDVREFDTKTESWLQVTINVDPGSAAASPRGRAFHGASFVTSQKSIYIYGGLAGSDYLGDFWRFEVMSRKWINITTGETSSLAGHTMTLVEDMETESLVVIGGFNPNHGLNDKVFEFNVERQVWETLSTNGVQPVGLYGHTAVYHSPTRSIYVFGGILYKVDRMVNSSSLYALHYPTKRWSLLTTVPELNPSEANVPAPRYLHSAATTDSYMIVAGGFTDPYSVTDTLLAYVYSCNYWMPLSLKEMSLVGLPLKSTAGIALARQSGVFYAFGGFGQGDESGLTKQIRVPDDICNVFSHRKDLCRLSPGCSFCVSQQRSAQSLLAQEVSACYTEGEEMPEFCRHQSSLVSKRTSCGQEKIASRNCYAYNTCSDCLGEWPIYRGIPQACQWCGNCKIGKCVPFGADCREENRCEVKQRETVDPSQCHERTCLASSCEKCKESGLCIWTRQVLRINEHSRKLHTLPIYDWNCVRRNIKSSASFLVSSTPPQPCPIKCSEFKTCKECLDANGAEGGSSKCYWSAALSLCISPTYVALQCLGGVCGTILSGNASLCPKSCSQFTKCADCLRQPECGWCDLESISLSGLGVCTAGSLDNPKEGSCSFVDYSRIADSFLGLIGLGNATSGWRKSSNKMAALMAPPDGYARWHYSSCPPEDECKNNHHDCNPVSERCVDQADGFDCICTDGYKPEGTVCKPVCTQGCINGDCTAPNICTCHFGFVGKNCSLQCDCNGHSNCEGPDNLDTCLECRNNTMGKQCSQCKPLFVGDPRNNGHCVSCSDYCSGHTDICFSYGLFQTNFSNGLTDFKLEQQDLSYWKNLIKIGPTSAAICLGCRNFTMGDKCEDCTPGYFRGLDDKRKVCRRCECHGHGDLCDPISGEGCNCRNNTESDPQCRFGGGFVSSRISGLWGSQNSQPPVPCWALQCDRCRESFLGNPINGHQCYRQMAVDTIYCFDADTQENCNLKPSHLQAESTVLFAIQPKFMNVDIRLIADATLGCVDVFVAPKDDAFVVKWSQETKVHTVDVDSKYVLPENIGIANISQSERYTLAYRVLEHKSSKLLTFVTVDDPLSIVIVRNLTNRLVLTLPQSKHDLRSTRFYVIIRSVQNQSAHGFLFFRQDQPRIDLFVFFSVFFSFFFLFLAASVIAWNIKSAIDARRARTRYVQEMQTMARRPFGKVSVVFELLGSPKQESPKSEIEYCSIIACRDSGIWPIASEPIGDGRAAIDTVLVDLPGGKEAPSRLLLGSSFVLNGSGTADAVFRRKPRRNFKVRFRRQIT